MSLINLAIRTCLKQALIGRTLAEDRVHDSMVVPLDETLQTGMQPRIIVSTDDDMIVSTSFDLNVDARDLDVIIEMEVSAAVPVEADGIAFQIPLTDAGLEASLDFLHRQVMRALAEPAAEWAELFRKFVGKPKKVLKRRGASNEKGVKFAARQIVITCEPANEPAYGAPPSAVWSRLIAAMQAEGGGLARHGNLLAAELTGAPLPAWRVLQASMGWSDAEVQNLGPAPLDPVEAGEPPVVVAVDLDDFDRDGRLVSSLTIADGPRASFEVPA